MAHDLVNPAVQYSTGGHVYPRLSNNQSQFHCVVDRNNYCPD